VAIIGPFVLDIILLMLQPKPIVTKKTLSMTPKQTAILQTCNNVKKDCSIDPPVAINGKLAAPLWAAN
jgi:hypothetical protein